MQEIPEEYRKSLETETITEQLARIDTLIASSKEVSAYNLGIKLALVMAQEIKEGKAPGTDSGLIIKEWAENYYPEFLEEVVGYAREFILKPQ